MADTRSNIFFIMRVPRGDDHADALLTASQALQVVAAEVGAEMGNERN